MNRDGALAALALALAVGLLAGAAASRGLDLSRAAPVPSWDSLVALVAETGREAVVLRSSEVALHDAPADGRLLVVPGGGRALREAELAAVERFVERGGRLLVLGDDAVAERFGARLAASPVRTTGETGEGLPATGRVAGREFALAIPDARPVLDGRPGAVALARTSPATFLDANGDGVESAADAAGPFVAASADAGSRVAVVGSRLLLAPEALRLSENHVFVSVLVDALAAPRARVYLDDARAASPVSAAPRALAGAVLDAEHDRALGATLAVLLSATGLFTARASAPSHTERASSSLDERVPRPRGGGSP